MGIQSKRDREKLSRLRQTLLRLAVEGKEGTLVQTQLLDPHPNSPNPSDLAYRLTSKVVTPKNRKTDAPEYRML